MTNITGNKRTRDFSETIQYPKISLWTDGSSAFPASSSRFVGRQETVSIGHRKTRGRYYAGGPFYTFSVTPKLNARDVTLKSPSESFPYIYKGPVTLPIPGGSLAGGFSAPSRDTSQLDVHGANAVNAVLPTNPNADAGVAIGEILIDRRIPIAGIPTWQNRTRLAQAAGSEYLNAVFGWMPLMRDMKDVAHSVLDSRTILENYRANQGNEVHREFEFDPIETSNEYIVSPGTRCYYSASSNVTKFNSTPVPLFCSEVSKTRRWFSGTFLLATDQSSVVSKVTSAGSEAEKLLGIAPTPEVIWNLAPWTWALDWVSNTGMVISNLSAFNLAGLVMKYGYIMEETSVTKTYFMPDSGLINHFEPPRSQVIYNHKMRYEANPFGFGVKWEGLSPTQLAISAALGITRLR